MPIKGFHSTDWRRLAAYIALLAVLTRALIPFGWMPVPKGTTSGLQIVICTLEGQQHVVFDQNGKPAPVHSDDQAPADHSTCAYTSSSHAASPLLTVMLLSTDPADSIVPPGKDVRVPQATLRNSWQSRAPPHQVSIA